MIYLHVPEASLIYFLDAYGKDEKDDLTPADKESLKRLAHWYRAEALAGVDQREKGPQS